VDNAGNVGIGTLLPRAPLHVAEGTSGASVNANACLALERNSVNYVNILAPDANEAGILFSKPAGGAAAGGIVYDHTATPEGLQFRTNGNVNRMVIDAGGDIVLIREGTPVRRRRPPITVLYKSRYGRPSCLHRLRKANKAPQYLHQKSADTGHAGCKGWINPLYSLAVGEGNDFQAGWGRESF
jgi:hypothetical protein